MLNYFLDKNGTDKISNLFKSSNQYVGSKKKNISIIQFFLNSYKSRQIIRSENKSIEYLDNYMNPSVEFNPQEKAIQYYTYQQMYRNVGEH